MTLLWILTAAVPVVGVAAIAQWAWRRSCGRQITTTEWVLRLRAADERMPLRPPKFRNRTMRTGFDIGQRPAARVEPVSIEKRRGTK